MEVVSRQKRLRSIPASLNLWAQRLFRIHSTFLFIQSNQYLILLYSDVLMHGISDCNGSQNDKNLLKQDILDQIKYYFWSEINSANFNNIIMTYCWMNQKDNEIIIKQKLRIK